MEHQVSGCPTYKQGMKANSLNDMDFRNDDCDSKYLLTLFLLEFAAGADLGFSRGGGGGGICSRSRILLSQTRYLMPKSMHEEALSSVKFSRAGNMFYLTHATKKILAMNEQEIVSRLSLAALEDLEMNHGRPATVIIPIKCEPFSAKMTETW